MEESCRARGEHSQAAALAVMHPMEFPQPESQGRCTHLSARIVIRKQVFPAALLPWSEHGVQSNTRHLHRASGLQEHVLGAGD